MNSRTLAHNLFSLSKKGVSIDSFISEVKQYVHADTRFFENVLRDLEYLKQQEESLASVILYTSDTTPLHELPEFAQKHKKAIIDESLVYGYKARGGGYERDASFITNLEHFRNHLKK